MTPSGIVTLLSDFGLEDPYVGVMKGALLRQAAGLQLVDLSHAIPPQSVLSGAFWLTRVWRNFPSGTVHLAVIDPGVGSARHGIVVVAHEHYFVGPDNGLLSAIHASDPRAQAWVIDRVELALPAPSRTFHGRDVFAPVAARLAAGILESSTVGQPLLQLAPSVLPLPFQRAAEFVGQVMTVDHFGNALTNLSRAHITANSSEIHAGGRSLRLLSTYSEAAVGEAFALFDSFDGLELAVRDGHAARTLALSVGSEVVLRERSGPVTPTQP